MLKNFKVIEVISQKSRALLTFYQGRLKFNHHTAAELNFSQYVQLAYDSNQQCFAIIAATKDSDNAVQFYNRGGDAKPYPISLYTKAAIETIENGTMTGDLAGLWEGEAPANKVTSLEFLQAIRERL